MDKSELRVHMRARRDAMSAQQRKALSERICAHAAALARPEDTVFVYASVGSEVETSGLIRALWAKGCRVCLPRIRSKGCMEAVGYASGDTLAEGRYGIPAPVLGDVIAPRAITLAFVPLLAYDESGGRIGYGGGYYDRYLAQSDARRVALAYTCQCTAHCPVEAEDIPMDALANEYGIINLRAADIS